ncbi:MAG: MarR family transcriptional regulator [Nanobdellota archaeon]
MKKNNIDTAHNITYSIVSSEDFSEPFIVVTPEIEQYTITKNKGWFSYESEESTQEIEGIQKLLHMNEKLESSLDRKQRPKRSLKRFPLNDNETLVLYGLCQHPQYTDTELAKKLSLKRSTVTTIRQRLCKKKYIRPFYLPNFPMFGSEIISIVNSNYQMPLAQRRKRGFIGELESVPQVIFSSHSANNSLSLMLSNNYIHFKQVSSHITTTYRYHGEKPPMISSFIFALDHIKVFNPSRMLEDHLGKKYTTENQSIVFNNAIKKKLTSNEKRIVIELIRHPRSSIKEIAKRTWKTPPTVSKVKQKLIEKQLLLPVYIPNFRKLSYNLVVLSTINMNQEDRAKVNEIEAEMEDKHTFMKIISEHTVIKAQIFRSYDEYERNIHELESMYVNNDIKARFNHKEFSLEKKSYSEHINFSQIIEMLLD